MDMFYARKAQEYTNAISDLILKEKAAILHSRFNNEVEFVATIGLIN